MAEHFAFSLFTLVFSSHYLHFFSWEMIFWQSFCDNLFDNFISYTHIIFLLYLSITLVSVSLSNFLCKLVVITKIVTQMIVQITHLFFLMDTTHIFLQKLDALVSYLNIYRNVLQIFFLCNLTRFQMFFILKIRMTFFYLCLFCAIN